MAKASTEKRATQLEILTDKDYTEACVELAEFVTPKLQFPVLRDEQARKLVKVKLHTHSIFGQLADNLPG